MPEVPSSSSASGVDISLETTTEWQIQEIGFDGQERYITPMVFSDHVAKLAHKIEWRELIGASASYDDTNGVEPGAESEGPTEAKKAKIAAATEEEDRRRGPETGPWQSVAKYLHQSLQQIGVLLDSLAVTRQQQYLMARPVADPSDTDQVVITQQEQDSKHFQWIVKRKALADASRVLEQALEVRKQQVTDTDAAQDVFLKQLRSLRERWRVKKIGNVILGDLGYRIFGTKFLPNETFDIRRAPVVDGLLNPHASLQVQVPRDLMRRATISVSIEKDDMGALFDEEVSSRAFRTADEEIMKTIHWSLALQWAQETLLCRDIFSLLTKQAVEMEDRFAVLKNGVLVVALHGEYLLKIRLTYHPFTDGEIPQKGVVYLGRCLRQMFVSDQSTRWIKHRVFTTMPLTDAPKSLHMSGLKAIPAEQVEQLSKGEKPLLTRTIQVASHFILVKKATAILDQIAARCEDPQIVWRWVRSSRMQSCAAVVISTRNYDNIGRLSFHVRITTERISIFTREAQIIDCARDEKQLQRAVEYLICQHHLNSLSYICRLNHWQSLHCNQNAADRLGNPTPTFYATNQWGTRAIYVQLHLDKLPTVNVKRSEAGKLNGLVNQDGFVRLDYQRLVGSSFCRKIENLFLMMHN